MLIRTLAFSLLSTFCLAAAGPELNKAHQRWLDGPASYLITKQERAAFLKLESEQQRDAFIARFWELRNPKPGTGTNEFREEFERRVAWANAQYGPKSGTDGWRSDMGRTYILFGKPKTSMSYVFNQELRPAELWFYSNPGLTELPPFFYVLFYEKEDGAGYRLYHPYVDGPEKLVRSGGTKAQAYRYLRGISPELARATLTLIPGEPVDTETFSGSMQSAIVLNGIQGYRDMPSYVALVRERARMLEMVSSRVEYDVARASLVTFVSRENGEPWLSWQIEIRDPLQPKAEEGRVEYRVSSRLFSGGRLVYERTDAPAFAAPASGADLNKRPFFYQDRMPVAPGKYKLVVSARNEAAGRGYEAEREFTVEGRPDTVALSDVLVVERLLPDKRERPFQFGGVRFTPMAAPQTQSVRGLRVLYQVALPEARPANLQVEYVIGSVASKTRKTFEEKLDPRQADSTGAVFVSKLLGTEELPPGAYQLAVRVTDPATGRLAARAAAFRIAASEEEADPIVVSRGLSGTAESAAANKYERALCWLAQGRAREALENLEASWNLSRNPAVDGLIRKLRQDREAAASNHSQEGKQ